MNFGRIMSDDKNLNSTTTNQTGSFMRVWPYNSEKDTLKAAEQYISLKTSPSNRRKIFDRLLITDEFFPAITPLLMSSFHRMEGPIRHQLLDHIIELIIKGKGNEFEEVAGAIAKLMSDSNFKLREKAGDVLIHMGEYAFPATVRLLPLLRNRISDIQLKAIQVISAIGPLCAKIAQPKVEMLLKTKLSKELQEAAERALRILQGEEKPLRPEIKIEGLEDGGMPEQEDNDEDDLETEEKTTESPVAKAYPAISEKTILIADDEKEIRTMLSKALHTCRARTKEASEGGSILKLIDAKIEIDLFILDLMMPNANGLEIVQALRNNDFYANVPIIIISARAERSILLKMSSLGVAAYFVKPFKLTEVLSRINLTLSQR